MNEDSRRTSKRTRSEDSVSNSSGAQRHSHRQRTSRASRQQRRHQEDLDYFESSSPDRDSSSNESDRSLPSDTTKPAGPSKRSKKHGIQRNSATRTTATAKRSPAPSPDPAPQGRTRSTRSARSGNARPHKGSATSDPQMLQDLREGTLKQSSLMPEHVHFDYPGKDWTDKLQPPPEATARKARSKGAWICKKPHAWGQYINASERKSCAGCGESGSIRDRMPWDLEFEGKDTGYVINTEENDLAYTPQSDFENKPGSQLAGRHPNNRAARMRIFLKRIFPQATEDELRTYWARPFEWTRSGKKRARELMLEIIEDVEAGNWADDLPRRPRRRPSRKTLKASKSSSRRSISSDTQEESIDELEGDSDLDAHTLLAEEQLAVGDAEARNTTQSLRKASEREPLPTALEDGDEPMGTRRDALPMIQSEYRHLSMRDEPAPQHPASQKSEEASQDDDGFYILVSGVLEGIDARQQAELRQYITRFCTLPAWTTMEQVPNDELFRHLTGFLSWEIHVEENPRLAMPLSQRLVDEVRGLRKEFWPDYKELLHALHDASAVHKRKLRRNPNAEI